MVNDLFYVSYLILKSHLRDILHFIYVNQWLLKLNNKYTELKVSQQFLTDF